MKVIITGATGMVGKGVLLECLENVSVQSVQIVNRQSVNFEHPKLKEIIHKDFFDLVSVQSELESYDLCFYCLGISAFRMSEEAYTKITYSMTMNFAKTLLTCNSEAQFFYVSGTGTNSLEKGWTMWARVKGKTENDLFKLGFKSSYAFRPAYIKPDPNTPTQSRMYKIILPVLGVLHPVIKMLFPNYTTTTTAIGKAMIEVAENGFYKKYVESSDINTLAAKQG
jgi:nucleoside-diphosphate-sugar epimerase